MAAVGEHYVRAEDGQDFEVIRVRSGAVWLSAGREIPGVILLEEELVTPDWVIH